MTQTDAGFPDGLILSFDPAPATEVRAALGQQINAFHGRTVPHESHRFAMLLHDTTGTLAAGISVAMSWQWMFVEALWVGDQWRGAGIGTTLLTRAEAHAGAQGCHSAWLDTFQARAFYLRLGYSAFGALEDYPPGQTRYFMRKRLAGEGAQATAG